MTAVRSTEYSSLLVPDTKLFRYAKLSLALASRIQARVPGCVIVMDWTGPSRWASKAAISKRAHWPAVRGPRGGLGGVAERAGWMEGISRAAQGGETGGPMSKARRIDRNIAGGGGGRGGEERTSVRRCLAAGRNGCSGPVALSRGRRSLPLRAVRVQGRWSAICKPEPTLPETHGSGPYACMHAARSTRRSRSRLRLKPLQRRIPRSEMP